MTRVHRPGPPSLDGERPLPAAPRSRRPALGHDPLSDPGVERADPLAWSPPAPAPLPTRPGPRKLSDVELGPPGLLDRLLDEDARRRITSLRGLAPEEGSLDPFGFSPEVARRALPAFLVLYRRWFRVRSRGHEHLPRHGPFIVAANHGGLLPFDGAMAVVDVLLHTDPPRLLRPLADRFVARLPGVREFFERVGPVIASRETFRALLRDGHPVLVFPEGVEAIRKPVSQRYRLQPFHTGFVRQALQVGVPIVPAAILGADDQAPILYDVKPLARRLGLPVAPITPTFPWLGPAGLVPYPVAYRIVYGAPFEPAREHGPEAAEDASIVGGLSRAIRCEIQRLVDRERS